MRIATVLTVLLAMTTNVVAAKGGGGSGGTGPTTPQNLRIVAVRPRSVDLVWDPSTSSSGTVAYGIRRTSSSWDNMSSGSSVPSFTDTGLTSTVTYSWYVYAYDSSGKTSGNSNTVTATLPRDTTGPAAPTLSVMQLERTRVALTWNEPTDDVGVYSYRIFKDGVALFDVERYARRIAVASGLTEGTSYVFTITARDYAGNYSAPSNAVTVTPQNSGDVEPPSTPAFIAVYDLGGCEVQAQWTESSDNRSSPLLIFYDVYINGIRSESLMGYTATFAYGNHNGPNTFEVFATDFAGNRSPTSPPVTLELQGCIEP